MRPRILLIGKNGQLGRELSAVLPAIGDLTALGRPQLDLSKPDEIRHQIRILRPTIIVNAAAYTAVDQAESDEPSAQAINADAPAIMAEEAKKIGSLLVHYSTDYVFDGAKRLPYVEHDAINPQNVYGKTKAAGELAIRGAGAVHLIFRTSWVYAKYGRNFLLSILRLATEREVLKIVDDQVGTPTSATEIAAATAHILEHLSTRRAAGSQAEASGIYHLTAGGETSWFGFAKAILKHASQCPPTEPWIIAATGGRPIIVREVLPISSAEFVTPARRPAYSVLSNALLAHRFQTSLPDWQTQLRSAFTSSAISDN